MILLREDSFGSWLSARQQDKQCEKTAAPVITEGERERERGWEREGYRARWRVELEERRIQSGGEIQRGGEMDRAEEIEVERRTERRRDRERWRDGQSGGEIQRGEETDTERRIEVETDTERRRDREVETDTEQRIEVERWIQSRGETYRMEERQMQSAGEAVVFDMLDRDP
ncbi:UNVERIFIED_CONTAM: hypothetical protein FKN15_010160 [Acipenser sinensis]